MVAPSLREKTMSDPWGPSSRGSGETMRRRTAMVGRLMTAALLFILALVVAGCGGGEKQDANEPEGTWKVDVISASFPGRQNLAKTSQLRIKVKNLEQRTLPNLAVTVDGFDQRSEDPDLSDPDRPRWVVEEPPDNSITAYTNTWAVGQLPGGATKTLVWKVTALRAGTYTLRYRVAGGLNGKAKTTLVDGAPADGEFVVRVSEKPRPVHID
jgi:hypothetical protein